MIETTKVTHGMLITICKYNDYQDLKNYENNTESFKENKPKNIRRYDKSNNTNKKEKNDNNDNNTNIYQGLPTNKEDRRGKWIKMKYLKYGKI